ncbi:uncharacterized protein si:rp71-46j2.7 [Brienomyrus brachyistius]|uniref:uncharacterized protein si:rp71-46j2.7 n=1 Tax=Brienomyrus brachyistius TaxID=42636 RepID=UPI0020B20FDE|nr:uncharacterized protein si:rp71-46j2.7 [Brienomyrus brachyistius]
MDKQPIYKALWLELDLATDRIMETVCALDIAAVSTGCIHIFTEHLHQMKEARRELLFSSWENEVAFLRLCSEALVQNFLPESTWKLDLYRSILKEIVAFKVLLQLVTLLSDPVTLNQLVVRYLDAASPCSSTEEPKDERTAAVQPEDDRGIRTRDSTGTADDSDNKARGKTIKASPGKKLKRFLGRLFKRTKKLKGENNEAETGPSFRALELQNLSDEEDDDSLCSSFSEDSSHLSSDQENMMHNLLNELWRDGRWTVTVPQVEECDRELMFTVHLVDQNSPEDLHWDVIMSEKQLQVLKVLQDSTHRLPLPDVLGSTDRILDDKFKEEARAKLENFLQSEVGQSQEVFHVLFSPFCDSLCDLLDKLPFCFSSTLDDEESVTHMKADQDEHRRQPGGSPEPPTESTGTCEDEGLWKVYECAKKVLNMDPSITRSDTSSNQFIHDSSGLACSLDQLAKQSTSEPRGPGKEQPPDPSANWGTDQPTDQLANRDRPAKQGTDQPTDQLAKQDRPAKRGTDQPTDQLANRDWPAKQGTDQPTDHLANRDRPAKQGTDQPTDQLANRDRPAKQGTDQPTDQLANRDRPAQRGTDQPTNQPADGGTDQCTEEPAVLPTPLLCSLSQGEGSKTNEKRNPSADVSVGVHGKEAKEQRPEREEKAASHRSSVDELMKALMDLLQEIFSSSWCKLTLKTLSKMFRPLVLKELTSVLDNLKLSDTQVASHLDSLRETLWPKGVPAVWGSPPTSQEKNKTKEKACSLLMAKSTWILKSYVKSTFEVLQDAQENKKLVYKLLSLLLKKLFPSDGELHSKAEELLKSPQ